MYKLILFLFIKFSISKKIIKIPFEVKQTKIVSSKRILSPLYEIEFYGKIKIGSNRQELELPFKLNRFPIFLSGSSTEIKSEKFKEDSSTTFSIIEKEIIKPFEDDFFEGVKSKDNFEFNKYTIENIQFLLSKKQKYEESGVIGLNYIPHSTEKTKFEGFDLINQLKNKNEIENYYFTFKFANKDKTKGEFIIGNAPHEYDSNYKEEKLVISDIEQGKYISRWILGFSNVQYGNMSLSKTDSCEISLSMGLFEGPFMFLIHFEKYFFNRSGCYEDNDDKYTFFYCEKSVNIKEFQDLVFVLKNKQMNFTFTYKDLFYELNDKYYFIILFNLDINMWKFGYSFIKKYPIVFNSDKRTLNWYNEPEKEFNIISLLLTICIIFAIIIGLLLVYIFILRPLKNKRKIRANELEEEFDYTPNNYDKMDKEENKLGI